MDELFHRPILITVLAAAYFFLGVLSLVLGTLLGMEGGLELPDIFIPGTVIVTAMVGEGVFNLIVAGGLWDSLKPVWYFAILMETLFAIFCLVVLVYESVWYAAAVLMIQLVKIAMLLLPSTKAYFRIGVRGTECDDE
jgi:hypothetical protein